MVTGHTGFKGSWLIVWLRMLGADVYGFSDRLLPDPSHFGVLGKNVVDHSIGNILDLDALTERFNDVQPDFVFHLAAQAIVSKSMTEPVQTIQTNVVGTSMVLEAVAQLSNPCSLICITSDKCYENTESFYGYRENDALGGKDPYSASKAGAEAVIHAYHHTFFVDSPHNLISVRAGNVVGGGDWAVDRLIPDLVRAWQSGTPVNCRRPESTRPWQHVLEPLAGYLTAGTHLCNGLYAGESFNFGPRTDGVYSVEKVIQEMSVHLPALSVVIDRSSNIHDAGLLKLNCDKALSQLSWQPVLDFKETFFMTADWYKRYYDLGDDVYTLTTSQIEQYCDLAISRSSAWAM